MLSKTQKCWQCLVYSFWGNRLLYSFQYMCWLTIYIFFRRRSFFLSFSVGVCVRFYWFHLCWIYHSEIFIFICYFRDLSGNIISNAPISILFLAKISSIASYLSFPFSLTHSHTHTSNGVWHSSASRAGRQTKSSFAFG